MYSELGCDSICDSIKNFAIRFEKILIAVILLTYLLNFQTTPNKGHAVADVYIYHVFPFRTCKSTNVRNNWRGYQTAFNFCLHYVMNAVMKLIMLILKTTIIH